MRPDSLWTNPLDCPFGKWGARIPRSWGAGWLFLCLASCQRARLIHFPNGRGICLRFVWPPCRAAWVSSSFGLREGVGCASLWVVGCVAKGYPSPPSAELPSAEGSRGVARSASSSLRRVAEGWWIAKGRFSLDGCSRLGFLNNGLVLFEGKVSLGFASRQGGRKGARLVYYSSCHGDTHRVSRVWARRPSAGRGEGREVQRGVDGGTGAGSPHDPSLALAERAASTPPRKRYDNWLALCQKAATAWFASAKPFAHVALGLPLTRFAGAPLCGGEPKSAKDHTNAKEIAKLQKKPLPFSTKKSRHLCDSSERSALRNGLSRRKTRERSRESAANNRPRLQMAAGPKGETVYLT